MITGPAAHKWTCQACVGWLKGCFCSRSLWYTGTHFPWRRCTVRYTCNSRKDRVSAALGCPSSRLARNVSTSSLASRSPWSSPSSTSPTGPPTSSARTRRNKWLNPPAFLLFLYNLHDSHSRLQYCFNFTFGEWWNSKPFCLDDSQVWFWFCFSFFCRWFNYV